MMNYALSLFHWLLFVFTHEHLAKQWCPILFLKIHLPAEFNANCDLSVIIKCYLNSEMVLLLGDTKGSTIKESLKKSICDFSGTNRNCKH